MSTFADPAAKASIRQRIEQLTPDSPRQWGKMTPHQLICHLSDGYRMSNGLREPRRVDNLISRSLIRWVAIHSRMQWPKGRVQTVPEADQLVSGTKPVEFEQDRAELVRLIETFDGKEGYRHPIFGPLTREEWGVWGWRHADHHLRQFGV